jgi:hypothetical protein
MRGSVCFIFFYIGDDEAPVANRGISVNDRLTSTISTQRPRGAHGGG